jgi:hypothetical protein
MLELTHNGYYPLSAEALKRIAPAQPGVYSLAVRLANGVHKTFFTSQTDNVFRSLEELLQAEAGDPRIPGTVRECLERYRCYFSYWVIINVVQRHECWQIVSQAADPVQKLHVINCN